MKRQIQLRGERYWAGDDLIDLQAEPVKAIDAIFAPYPACVISGCGITQRGANFDVAAGYVSLKGTSYDNQSVSYVVPFAGVVATTLPIYLTLHYDVVSDLYGDGGLKPIAHNYSALATTVKPSAPYLEISTTAATAFVDVVQDAAHRFLTDTERVAWNRTLADINTLSNRSYTAVAGIVDYTELDGPPFVLQDKDLIKLKGDFSVSCSENYTYTVTHNAGKPNLPHVNAWGGMVGIGPLYGPVLSNITNNSFDIRNWSGCLNEGNSWFLTFTFSIEVF